MAAETGAPSTSSPPVATTPAAADATTTYTVNFSPVWTVGQKFDYVADASTRSARVSSMPSVGARSPDPVVICHVAGSGECLAVSKNGVMTKMSLVVTSINVTEDGKPIAPKADKNLPVAVNVPAVGAKIVVERDDAGVESFTVDGKPTSPSVNMRNGAWPPSTTPTNYRGQINYLGVAKFLSMLLPLADPQNTEQDSFSPQTPVAVGATWPLTAAGLAAFERQLPLRFAAPEINPAKGNLPSTAGEMKLESVSGSANDRVFVVSANIAVENANVPPDGTSRLSADLTQDEKMNLSGNLSIHCPVTTQGTLSKTSALTIQEIAVTTYKSGKPFSTDKTDYNFNLSQQFTFK